MLQAIPTVYNKIFGISYLQGEEAQQLKDQWQLRMGERDAFFIEAEPGEDYKTTVTSLCHHIQGQGIMMNAHEPCILTFFVDLQERIDLEQLRKIEAGIKGVLGSNIQAVIQFGYVGKMGLEDPTGQRENACKLVKANQEFPAVQHRLLLVASPFLAGNGSNEWKSVCVYLDVLSRQIDPSNLLPGIGSGYAGFLRYGEYDQETHSILVKRLNELNTILEKGDIQKFEALLKDKEMELRNMVKQNFPIHGTCQPLHPDMFLEPGFLNRNHKKAQSGNHSGFNAAQESSETAAWMTGERLKKDIARAFEPSIANAEAILKELAEAAPLGLALREDADEMIRLLTAPADSQWEPSRVSLPFSENGYAQEINIYLEKIREHALDIQVQRFYAALQRISNTLVDEAFAKKKTVLEKERKTIQNRLGNVYPTEKFCERYGFSADLPQSQFSPVTGNGVTQKFLLCTNGLTAEVENSMTGAGTPVYYMANSEPDGVPLKGVQIVFLVCSEEKATRQVMYQLLPEVNV